MKKAVIILSLFVLLLGGCKQKTTPENSMPPQADTLHVPQTETQRNATKYDRIDEFNANPPVSAEEIAAIAPIIKKWTDFYKLDFAQARLMNVDTACFNCPQDDNQLYYYKFTEEEKEFNTDKKIDAQYSPNKQLYLEFIYAAEKNGKYYHSGFDDSQNVWLIDRRQKHATTMNYRSYAIW